MREPAERSDAATGYRVLARKYRPRDFSDLIGQAPMVRTLTNAFATGRIAQAYMLTGVRGVGKTTTARILARALNYKTPEIDRPTIDLGRPGEHCQAIMEGRHVDVIEMDAASHTGIDDIREIIEQVRYRPVSARYKVYIIDEVHMLSTQAFNGLLKTLEEPPEHVKFIFATTEIRKVPITVLSRCQRFDLRRIDAGLLVNHFRAIAAKEKVSVDEESLTMIARAAEGSVRDGLSLMDQAIAHGGDVVEAETVRAMLGLADRSRIVDLFRHVASGNVTAALAEYRDQYDGGASPSVILTDLADLTHLVTRLKFVPSAGEDAALTEAERTGGMEMAEALSVPTLSRLWQMLLKGIAETEASNRPAGAAEMVLIRLTHAANLPSPEDAARQLAALSEDSGGASRSAPPSRPVPNGNGASAEARATAAIGTAGPGMPASRTMGSGATLRAVPAAEPDDAPAVAPAMPVPPPTPKVTVANLADLAALADKHRDITTKIHLRKHVRPVRIEPGRLEINLTEDAPKTLPGTLSAKLETWTGMRWIVMLSREAGGETLDEIEAARREALVVDARQDPDVAAILQRFPGARIADVKIRIDEAAETAVAAESDEGDILPEAPGETD
ncbi:MAG: DNA polymerase III subunit gamma/tau [Pararhizobium sp.]